MALAQPDDSQWRYPFETLRKKWGTVPFGLHHRQRSAELLSLSDAELARCWLQRRESDVEGAGFQQRGWFHELYKDFMRDRKVLDIGCGFGISSISFLEFGAAVTFVDIVEENVKLVSKVCRGLNLDNRAEFLYMHDVQDLGALSRDYDVVTAIGSLHHTPFDVQKREVAEICRHLKVGGRWLQFAYPKARWEREGSLPFEKWGEKTDGEGTPYCEWYDMAKVRELLAPTQFEPIFYYEWHNQDFNWFDLKLLTHG